MHCVNFFRNIYRKYSKATEQTGGFSLASCCLTTFSIQTDTEGWEVHAAGVSGSPLAAPLAQVLNSLPGRQLNSLSLVQGCLPPES